MVAVADMERWLKESTELIYLCDVDNLEDLRLWIQKTSFAAIIQISDTYADTSAPVN